MGIQAWKNHFHAGTKRIGLITDHFFKKEMCHNISEMDKRAGAELKMDSSVWKYILIYPKIKSSQKSHILTYTLSRLNLEQQQLQMCFDYWS